MLEIKIVTDNSKLSSLCLKCGITDTERKNVLAANDGEEVIAFTVFTMDENSLTLERVYPQDDIMMTDGMVRSTMHIAATRGLETAYYTEDISEATLSKLGLIKSKAEKTLDIEALFREKCCGK